MFSQDTPQSGRLCSVPCDAPWNQMRGSSSGDGSARSARWVAYTGRNAQTACDRLFCGSDGLWYDDQGPL